MPNLTGQASAFRAGDYRYTGYLSTVPMVEVFRGEVSGSPNFPLLGITFVNSVGTAANVQVDMHVVVFQGSTTRIKGTTRVGPGAVSGSILNIAELSRGVIDLQSGDIFRVYDAYRIRDKLVSATIDLNKDSRIAVSDFPSNPPPVANAGGLWAGFVDPSTGLATVQFNAAVSYTVDPDSAGTLTYLWDVKDGTITAGSTTTAAITVTFPAGFRHVRLTVTDAGNGKSTRREIPVWAHDTSGNTPLAVRMRTASATRENGWRAEFDLPIRAQNALDALPDGALTVYWEDERYGSTAASYGSNVTGRSHIKFVGFLIRETIELVPGDNTVAFDAEGPLAILEQTPALPQLMISGTAANWNNVKALTVNRALWYLARWHTSALTYFDFLRPDGSDLSFARIAVQDTSSIAAQLRDVAESIAVDVTCDRLGRLLFVRNFDYLSSADRSGRTKAYDLTTADMLSLDMPREHRGSVKFVRGEGITTAGGPVFSNAPGNAPAWFGTRNETYSRQIVTSQTELNRRTGLHFARENGLFNGQFVPRGATLTLPDGYDVFDPAYNEAVTLTLPAAVLPRGAGYDTAARWTIERVDIDYEAGGKSIRVTLDHETDGPPGVTYIPPQPADNGLPTFPPIDLQFPSIDFGGFNFPTYDLPKGTGRIAAFNTDGNLYITNDFGTPAAAGGPTWQSINLSLNGTVQDFVVDAFSPLYVGTGATVNGWIATTTRIYRIVDIFNANGTRAVTSQHTFTNPVTNNVGSRTIQMERLLPNFVVCASWYSSVDATPGLSVTRTTDGVNWSETFISSNYSTVFFWTPGIYVSGHISGAAYTSANTNIATVANFVGYRTVNSGASWASFTVPDVRGGGLAGGLHVPFHNNAGDDIMWYSSAGFATMTTLNNLTIWRANGASRSDRTPVVGGVRVIGRTNHSISTCPIDRTRVLISGNDASVAPTRNAMFISSDEGLSWTQITPFETTARLLACSVGGDNPDILYMWGENGRMAFSDNAGATVDERTGNISTTGRHVNICGG